MKRSAIAAVVMLSLSASSFAANNMADFSAAFDSYKAHMNDSQADAEYSRLGLPASYRSDVDGSIRDGATAEHIASVFDVKFGGNTATSTPSPRYATVENVNAADHELATRIAANKADIAQHGKALDGLVAVNDGQDATLENHKERLDIHGQEIARNGDAIKGLNTALDGETTARQNADNALAATVVAEESARASGDANLQTQVDTNKNDIATNKANIDKKVDQSEFNDRVTLQQARDGGQDNAIAAEAATRQKADLQHTADIAANKTAIADRATKAELANGLSQKVDNSTFTQRSAVVDSRFADTDARIAEQKASQAKVNKAVADSLDNHEGRIADLERNSNKGFAELKNQIDKNAKKANAGTSTALAAAGIPQVTGDQRFTLGAATGGYEGEQALAVGFSARVSTNVTVKASVGTDTQHGVGYNAGVAVGW